MSDMVKLDASRYASQWRMRNGVDVTVRPICPEDESLMVRFHQTFSDRTVYFRLLLAELTFASGARAAGANLLR
jgi:hypothetical protein